MTSEELSIKTILDNIVWTTYRINLLTPNSVKFGMDKKSVHVIIYDSEVPVFICMTGFDNPRFIEEIKNCERRLYSVLRSKRLHDGR